MATTLTPGSATISTTEFFLASNSTTQTPQTTTCIMQAWIDFNAMAAGDQYQITVYEKINGTQRAIYFAVLQGAQSQPGFVVPSLIVGEGWDIGVKKLAGTDRTIPWSIRKAT